MSDKTARHYRDDSTLPSVRKKTPRTYRTRIDPPTGMLSGVLLGKIRGGIEQGVAEGLRTAKQRTEAQ